MEIEQEPGDQVVISETLARASEKDVLGRGGDGV